MKHCVLGIFSDRVLVEVFSRILAVLLEELRFPQLMLDSVLNSHILKLFVNHLRQTFVGSKLSVLNHFFLLLVIFFSDVKVKDSYFLFSGEKLLVLSRFEHVGYFFSDYRVLLFGT